VIHLSSVSRHCDPIKHDLTVPMAIVHLLTKVLGPNCMVHEFTTNHLVLVNSTGSKGIMTMDTFDADEYLEMVCLLQALFLWAGLHNSPMMGITIRPNSYWLPYAEEASKYNHFEAKFILFITLDLFDLRRMLELAQYDIVSLAHGFERLMADPTLSWEEIIPTLNR
jgi:hypothetical protein